MKNTNFTVFMLCFCQTFPNACGFTTVEIRSLGKGKQDSCIRLKNEADDNCNERGSQLKRRNFLFAVTGLLSVHQWTVTSESNNLAWAAAEDTPDLTTQLFNPDGSLKGEIEAAKTRDVQIGWEDESSASDKYAINIDGTNREGTQPGSKVKISYQVPEKWEQRSDGYIDISTPDRVKACEKITVYRAPGKVTPERLAKATTIGLAEALYVTDDLKVLQGADLVSGRTRKQGDIKFYDFDLAVAPKTCGDSKDNLGLGFCPFDSIYLLSAAVVNDQLYVMAVESDKAEWKVANADLKRVRSSFSFNEIPLD